MSIQNVAHRRHCTFSGSFTSIRGLCCLACGLTLCTFVVSAAAQNLSESSVSSSTSDTPVGATISQQVQEFSEGGSPALQTINRADLRDTQSRGSFVGADSSSATLTETMSQTGGRTSTSTRRTQTRTSQFRPQQSAASTQVVRPTLTLGFSFTPTPPANLGQNIEQCIKRIPALSNNSSIRISLDKNVVVLEGVVASERDRMLSAQLVALTPGVVQIDNRLTVAAELPVKPSLGQ